MSREAEELNLTLTLPNTPHSVSIGGACVAEAASSLDFAPRSVSRLRLAVEEAVQNAVKHAYQPNQSGLIEIEVCQVPLGIQVKVKDQGIPFQPSERAQHDHLHGWSRMTELMDRVSYHNLGRQGKEVELTLYQHETSLKEHFSPGELEPIKSKGAEVQEPVSVEVRLTRPEEILGVCRAIYRTYGYSYDHDVIYYPQRFAELMERGLVVSAVAVTPDGEVVGHSGLSLDLETSPIANLGMSVVNPELRGQGVAGKLGYFLNKTAREKGLQGLFCMSVTTHTYSQMAMHKGGYQDCGILLGFTPASTSFRGIAETLAQRESLVIAFRALNPLESHPVYAPPKHREEIVRLLTPICPDLEILDPEASSDLPEETEFVLEVAAERGQATFNITKVGRNAEALLQEHLRKVKLQKIEIVLLKINLHSPELAQFSSFAEKLGFFFCGVLPGWRGEGAFLMTYLNNVSIDVSKLQLHSDSAKALVAYVSDCMKETELSPASK